MDAMRYLLGLLLCFVCSTASANIMLISSTDTLEIDLSAAKTTNDIPCVASYYDYTTTTATPGRGLANTNGTTDTELVAPPGASTYRVINAINCWNADTAAKTLTIQYNANNTKKTLWSASLGVGERVEYTDKSGFSIYSSTGGRKIINDASAPVSSDMTYVIAPNDVVNNNASANTIADVTGLSFAVTNGYTYYFRFSIPFTSAATTTGSRWSINGPTTSFLTYKQTYSLAATTNTYGAYATYDQPAGASATAPADLVGVAIIEGFITPSADGTLIARFASEVSGSAVTAKAGAIVGYKVVKTP
jgi:hypothetical protein